MVVHHILLDRWWWRISTSTSTDTTSCHSTDGIKSTIRNICIVRTANRARVNVAFAVAMTVAVTVAMVTVAMTVAMATTVAMAVTMVVAMATVVVAVHIFLQVVQAIQAAQTTWSWR